MKNKIISISTRIAFLCLIGVLLLSIMVFQDAFFSVFDFTTIQKVNISTTINSLATPVISLISVILLFITLNKQIESNYFQVKSKNLDLILAMYNQLQKEYENFTYTKRGTRNSNGKLSSFENEFKGYDALVENLPTFRIAPEKFGPSYQSDKIIKLVDSFNLVDDLIESMILEENVRYIFNQNMNSFYKVNFRPVFLSLAFLIRNNSNSYSKELISFVTKNERKTNPDFNIDSFKKESELFEEFYNTP